MPLTATAPSPPPRSRCIKPRRSELYDPEAGERSEHRAVGSFRPSGKIYRYRAADAGEGATALSAARDLEKQAQQLSAGWERELAIALDASFPFSALLPLIAEFYAQNPQTRLNFSHHTLAGSWEELTHHGADIILGAINEPPTSAEWSWQTLGALDNIFVVAPHHPLAQAKEPLANKQLSQHRAIVIRDSARYCHPLNSNLLDEKPQIGVDDFASKVELLCAGLGCGFLPRHIARPWLVKGSLVEKSVACWREKDITYMAWRSGNDGLAQRWWREALLRGDLLSQLYH